MSITGPYKRAGMPEGEEQSTVRSRSSATKSMTDPSILIASLGLACLFATSQGMRITTLAGIYPIEGSLIMRHTLALCTLALVALLLRKGRLPHCMVTPLGYGISGVLLCIALLARYSFILTGAAIGEAEIAGKLVEEALCCLLIVLWANRVLQGGLIRAATTVAYGFLAQAALQLLLSFLQRVPCAVLLTFLPLASIGFYCAYVRTAKSAEEGSDQDASSSLPQKALLTIGVGAGIVFCLSFILGGVIFESLDAQIAMADEPLSQLCIIIGNVIGAFALIFTIPYIRNRAYCTIFLMACFACCAISLYLTTFLVNEAVGGYLIASSIGLQGTLLFIWYGPFLVGGGSVIVFRHYVGLYAAHICAKVLSSVCMLLHRTAFDHLFSILISVSLIVLFCCCAFIILRSLDATRTAEEPPMHQGESAARSPSDAEEGPEVLHQNTFEAAVGSLADEYHLTRQERRVLLSLARGLNANAISEKMVISINTTKSHMRNIYAKLDVHSQQEIIALANEREVLLAEGADD